VLILQDERGGAALASDTLKAVSRCKGRDFGDHKPRQHAACTGHQRIRMFGLAKNSILPYLISKIFLVYKIRSNAYGTSEDYHARSAYPAH